MEIKLILFKVDRNHAFVLDIHGNKLFYGTVYQCQKFMDFVNGKVDEV